MDKNSITLNEKKFCEYYIKGSAPYAGDATLCYLHVFSPNNHQPSSIDMTEASIKASELLSRPEIQEYADELSASVFKETESVKRYVTESLKSIIREATEAEYRDRNGTVLSPAPLRSVAVNAAKALMEIYPIKATQAHQINVNGGDGNSGITFNLIVPNQQSEQEPQK